MDSPRVYVYQFANGAQWAAGDSVEGYLRRLLDVDFSQALRADRLAAVAAFLDESFQLAHTLGWSGTARELPQMFSLPGVPADEAIYMIAWEQDDGVAYIASPFPLPWLDAKATRTIDSSLAVPMTEDLRISPRATAHEVEPEPAEDESDPFADFVRREDAARLSREPSPLPPEEGGRRFF